MITRLKLSTIEQGLPKYRSMLAGNDAYIPTSFESIATVTATGGESSLSFTSIPATYQHLQVRGIARDTSTAFYGDIGLKFRFNSDSGNNYASHQLYGNGSSAGTSSATSANGISGWFGQVNSGSSNTTVYGVSILDIHDYASTTKNKTTRLFAGSSANQTTTDFGVALSSGLWMSTSAITSITILANYANIAAGTTFALYGIRGA